MINFFIQYWNIKLNFFIAKKNNLNMFDYKVAESYWIGNELLDKFTISDLEELIDNLVKRGMLKSEGERLKSKLVKGFVPHHIFHVFFIEIGKVSSKIEPLFKFKETCRPSCGKIKQIFEDKLIVIRTPIIFENNEYKLALEEEKEIKYDKFLLSSLKCGDFVAIHWDVAVLKLNKIQVSNMEKYTINFLKLINDSYKK